MSATFLRWVGTMDGHKFESLEVIVDDEQGLIVERTIALRTVSGSETVSATPCMHRSKISCRPMFGTTQRPSVGTTGVSDRVDSPPPCFGG
jgi:hypothetical protein